MNKIYSAIIIVTMLLIMVLPTQAIELSKTPIQTKLQNSILLATDNWNLGSDEGKKNSTVLSNKNSQKKSALKAALYSALLPGLGEHYVGNRTKSKVFFAIEATTWLSYFAFNKYGDWKKDDAIRFASSNAGASLEDKDDEFFDWVGFYNSSEDFNSLGRVSDPERAYLSSSDTYWQWSSDADREAFRTYKNSSRSAYDRANFMIMAAISSRIISIIDAIRDANRHNKNAEKIDISKNNSFNYKFSLNPMSENNQFSITLFTPF